MMNINMSIMSMHFPMQIYENLAKNATQYGKVKEDKVKIVQWM